MGKILLTLICLSVTAVNCLALDLQTGDLLFQVRGESEFSDAISASTGTGDSVDFVHVAIIYVDSEENISVIEASPADGVRMIALSEFLSDCTKIGGKPGVVVKHLVCEFPVGDAVKNAMARIGEGYDWYYLPDNGMMYCSELIYESFLTADGRHIFQSQPMNFRLPDGSMPGFWVELYKELGVDVPEGIPGTNPNDMSKDPNLTEVFRFF